MGQKVNVNAVLAISVFLIGLAGNVSAGTIYVDANAALGGDGTTWGTAYKYLQDALYKPPASGDEIWVAAGTYKPDQDEGSNVTLGDRNATFGLINGVSIYGGFQTGGSLWEDRDPNQYETILSGDLNGDDGADFANNGENSYHVIAGSNITASVTIDGFTVTAGNATGASANEGAGMYLDQGSPNIRNCTFINNDGDLSGGGISIYPDGGSPVVENCRFENNRGDYGGGFSCVTIVGSSYPSSMPVFKNCSFVQNTADEEGGAIFVTECVMSECIFIDNYSKKGGAIYLAGPYEDSSTLRNCKFVDNSALGYGGGIYLISSPTLIDCEFLNNTSTKGGAIYFEGLLDNPFTATETYPTVISSTFVGNTAGSGGGGAIHSYSATRPSLINCKFVANYSESDGGAINVYCYDPRTTNIYFNITNCSFAGNKAAGTGGAYVMYSDDVAETTITNTILWSNGTFPQVTGGTLIVTSSCIQDDNPDDASIPFGGSANNNIDDNPNFTRDPNDGGDGWGVGDNDDYGNLRLQHTSPCIDTADNAAVPADSEDLDEDLNTAEPIPYDLDDHPRIVDGDCDSTATVDMGAYEFAYLYLGDFAGGCDVDLADFVVLALAWLTEEGQGGYDSNCDIAVPYDRVIDEKDLQVFTTNWLVGK